MITGVTSYDYDDKLEIKRKIKEFGTNNVLNNIPTEEIEVFLRSKKIKKLKNIK